MNKFEAFNIKSIPPIKNYNANMLENVTSNLSPSNDFTHDRFFVEVIYRSSIPYNITNWGIFDEDQQIIEGTLRVSVIDDEQHESLLQASISEEKLELRDIFPKNIVRMENHFDLQDTFRKTKNNSSWKYEVIDIYSIKEDTKLFPYNLPKIH